MKTSVFEIAFKAIVIIGLTVLVAFQFVKQERIAYVDAMRLLNGYKGMQAARQEFETKSGMLRANLDTLRTELQNEIANYERTTGKISSKEKALMEELISTKQQQYIHYENVVNEKIQKEDQEITTKVLERVNDYVRKYGEEKDFEIILAATQYGNIVYARDGMDITDEVLKELNEGTH
jgi:outer membrane protein